jgi:hypothetical protein
MYRKYAGKCMCVCVCACVCVCVCIIRILIHVRCYVLNFVLLAYRPNFAEVVPADKCLSHKSSGQPYTTIVL